MLGMILALFLNSILEYETKHNWAEASLFGMRWCHERRG